MNWNDYDTKYIIKRLIIGFGMLILFSILTANKAHALTQAEHINYIDSGQTPHTYSMSGYTQNALIYRDGYLPPNVPTWEPFFDFGEGNFIFTIAARNTTSPSNILSNVYVGNDADLFSCDMGSMYTYNDNTVGVMIITLNCPVNFKNGHGLKFIRVERNGAEGTTLWSVSHFGTFVSKDNVNVNVNQQQVVSAIVSSQTETIQAIESQGAIAHQDAQQAINQAHQDAQAIYNNITSDNVDGANNDLDNFKNNSTFSDSTGLQAVLELPLNLVNSFTNTCQPISITIPWLNYTGTIPCMSTIYRRHFSGLYSVVALIVNAFFIYRILLKIYELVHSAKQPDEDKLEVIEL